MCVCPTAQAIQAVSGLKEHPEEAARELAAAGAKAPAAAEVAVRVAGLEQSVVYIQVREICRAHTEQPAACSDGPPVFACRPRPPAAAARVLRLGR